MGYDARRDSRTRLSLVTRRVPASARQPDADAPVIVLGQGMSCHSLNTIDTCQSRTHRRDESETGLMKQLWRGATLGSEARF